MKFLPPPLPLSPYPSATRPNGCRENINTPPQPPPPAPNPSVCLNQTSFFSPVPGNPVGHGGLKRKGGGGWEEWICTKPLLRPETARPCPPLTATGCWLGLDGTNGRLNARQTSKAACGDKVAKWNTGFERVISARGSNTRDLSASLAA